MLWNKVSWPIFFISFAVGLFMVYVFADDVKKVYVYPTPDNVDKILFKDKTGNCSKFSVIETTCPAMGADPFPVAE
jgi:hypothetical protein